MQTVLSGKGLPFIKIGNTYINPENITSVMPWVTAGNIRIDFIGEDNLKLTGEEAEAFLKWLDKEALDITPVKALAVGDDDFEFRS